MTVSTVAAFLVFRDVLAGNTFNEPIYTWITTGDISLEIGFLIDRLSATMMLVVTFVSLMVHIYTIGYMADDPGYQRFFSYISLFTFSMLMLVMSNNFLQLFFGWEAVGLVSYLLIGFWYTRPTAIYANLKAFLVNRVGDLGFLLGIALILVYFGTLDYAQVFSRAPELTARDGGDGLRRLAADYHDLHPAVHRRDGQIGAVSAARLAAGLDGRPDADLGTDSCRDHGNRRHFHGGAHVAAVRVVGNGAVVRDGDRRNHRIVHGAGGNGAERYQAGGGLFDAVATRLHDRGARRLGLRRRPYFTWSPTPFSRRCCSSAPAR